MSYALIYTIFFGSLLLLKTFVFPLFRPPISKRFGPEAFRWQGGRRAIGPAPTTSFSDPTTPASPTK